MTLGEKLKEARKNAGLSQEQLAEKLCVSRAAVAKWETDKGIPDIMNLKAISTLLDTSIDALLDDGRSRDILVTKEPINLDALTVTGRARCKHDMAVLSRFPEADSIHQVWLTHQLNKIEWWLDFLTGGNRRHNGLQRTVQQNSGIPLRKFGIGGNDTNQLLFVHDRYILS